MLALLFRLRLAADNTPDFIALDVLAAEPPNLHVMEIAAQAAEIGQEAQDRELADNARPSGGVDADAFNQRFNHAAALLSGLSFLMLVIVATLTGGFSP